MDSRPGPGQSEYHSILASVIDSEIAAGSEDGPIRVLRGFFFFFHAVVRAKDGPF